jgi:hypothetical protein
VLYFWILPALLNESAHLQKGKNIFPGTEARIFKGTNLHHIIIFYSAFLTQTSTDLSRMPIPTGACPEIRSVSPP